MYQFSGFLKFKLDPQLPSDYKKKLESLLTYFKNADVSEIQDWNPEEDGFLHIQFVSEGGLHLLKPGSHLKICLLDQNQGLFSFEQNLEASLADFILDELIDLNHLQTVIKPRLDLLIANKIQKLNAISLKNLKRFESLAKNTASRLGNSLEQFSSEVWLEYAQALVNLEKELIHADDSSKIEKILKFFSKNYLGKSKFQYIDSSHLASLNQSKTLLPLPPFKNEFQAIEINWEDESSVKTIQIFFFYHTLVQFFYSQQVEADPFFDQTLWEETLDLIPFPVVLMSKKAEVRQHNKLFAKLNFPPSDCLKLKLREKTTINEIPYNIFRKDVLHLNEEMVLFVFFTESFFLKGDDNLTPTGQELGIITSSIAHELNNPIAGIQAAITLLMLDDDLKGEAEETLREMKNGSLRCKQLIETFLGFSRANPSSSYNIQLKLSPIQLCYQQAQNLLRFRTVESGIRFSLDYSKHTDFRAGVNLSLLTMTFYLIMGELMTLYSHQMLVANKNQIEKIIKGEVVESSQEIQIQLNELNISELEISKLIQNLLTIENLVLQVSDYSLRFIYNPPRDV
jgi:hypothetical protein